MLCWGSRTVGRPPISARARAFDGLIRPEKAYFNPVFGAFAALARPIRGATTPQMFHVCTASVPKVFPSCYLVENSRYILFLFSCL
jgi:hypothetical protein